MPFFELTPAYLKEIQRYLARLVRHIWPYFAIWLLSFVNVYFELLLLIDLAKSCSDLKNLDPNAESGFYVIDPDGEGGLLPYNVTCDMSDKGGVGVTVISHDSENRTLVDGCEPPGCYSRNINYTGASLSQLAGLTNVSLHCEQFIKYECHGSVMFSKINNKYFAWWVSRDSLKMLYWGGAAPDSGKCACGMNGTCAKNDPRCNCDANDAVWREDSGLLTDKTRLPVKQLRFGDTKEDNESGWHTLGKFKCYGNI